MDFPQVLTGEHKIYERNHHLGMNEHPLKKNKNTENPAASHSELAPEKKKTGWKNAMGSLAELRRICELPI